MGSETMKLPIIDFSNLKQQTPKWESVKIQVLEPLEEYDCFEAIFDEIPLNLRKSVIDGLQQLFDLLCRSNDLTSATVPIMATLDNTQRFHSTKAWGSRTPFPLEISKGSSISCGPKAILLSECSLFHRAIVELDKARKMVLESLGEKYMDEHMDSTNYFVRF
ncbi:hypothetical protein DH2020_041099 [Rehmannia glutinosa]|uniref:Uncharacterized protein n=1 Tax=Rehmannia glutinosa TaxID=99300 RepID=A0ABR0URU5_REHGL